MASFLTEHKRTHYCADLRKEHVGQTAVLLGWVQIRRDLGGRIFIDLRDRTGLAQIVFGRDITPETYAEAETLRNEFCVGVVGKVKLRTASGGTVNPNLPTGEIEIEASSLHVFSRADHAAVPHRGRRRHPRGDAAQVPLPRPPPAEAAEELSAP